MPQDCGEKAERRAGKAREGLQEGNGLGVILAGWLMEWHRTATRKEKGAFLFLFLPLPSKIS